MTGRRLEGTVLVVDDDAGVRETLEIQLGRLGLVVRSAASAEEAMEALEERPPDVMVTDVRLPGADGIVLLRRALERYPDLPVVVVTGHETMPSAVLAMKEGARDYLAKPLDLAHLEAALERCLTSTRAGAKQPGPVTSAPELVGTDPGMLAVFKAVGMLARSRSAALIRGETGTGKELVARAIHAYSEDASRPFVAVNCSALPEHLLTSELFGHVRGAFTGAATPHRGRFEVAGRGTILLDEIGDTSLAFQSALLRVLDEGAFTPVGGEHPVPSNARVLAATHRPLERMVADGTFREDLYFRLRAMEIRLPPLRERPGDLPALVRHFLPRVSADAGVPVPTVNGALFTALRAYPWPGNVRELRQALLRGATHARGGRLRYEDLALGLDSHAPPTPGEGDLLDGVVAAHVRAVLHRSGGNKSRCARLLGISRARLDRILRAAERMGSADDGTA